MYIYLIRHTTPNVSRDICYGQTDLDVVSTFEEEANQIRALLPDLEAVPFYSSPLLRCKKLAHYLKGEQIIFDDRLKEMNFGDWEMMPWADINPEKLQLWMKSFVETRTPNGECQKDVYARVVSFWEELISQAHPTVAVVAHYGILQSLVAYLLQTPLEKAFRIELGYGAMIRIHLGEKGYCKIKFLR